MTARASSPISRIALTTCFLMNACVSTGAPGKNGQPNSSADTTEPTLFEQSRPINSTQPGQAYAEPPATKAAPAADGEAAASENGSAEPSVPRSLPEPAPRAAKSSAGYNAPSELADRRAASTNGPRGEARAPAPLQRDVERPGLATQWGETRSSSVTTTAFDRNSNQPTSVLRIQYDDEAGILARAGLHRFSELLTNLTETSNGFVSVQIIDEVGRPLAGLTQGSRTFVVGRSGDRYSIRVSNHSSERFEVLATVDGLDVIDGRPGSMSKRGYLVDAHQALDIDGFRRSSDAVAAFRFGSVRDSYAARTGSDRNVGVIGIAIFRERNLVDERRWEENRRRDNADPFPSRYAAPPPVPMIRN